MRTRETVLTLIAVTLTLALTLVPTSLAQEEDPSLNESEMDTNPPASDESYLDEAEQESSAEPTLTESEMDTSAPAFDESYLDEAEREIGAEGSGSRSGSDKATPGAPLLLVAGAVGAAAFAMRRVRS